MINKKYRDFEYLVYATPMGHRCGYVRIPSKHYLYGKHYGDQLKIRLKDLKNEPIGKRGAIPIFASILKDDDDRVSMDVLFDVHGSITFSGKGKEMVWNKPGYWIGFDCAHCDDGKDPELMGEKEKELHHKYSIPTGGGVRTREYVEQECKNLIDQIIKYFEEEK